MGQATALAIGAAGASVAVNDIDAAAAQRTCDEVAAAGGIAVPAPGDVANPEGARAVVAAAVAGLGQLTGLVNNVGLVRGGKLLDITEAEWDFVMRVDCSSALFVSQAAYPHLIATGGVIVNNSSLCAVFPAPGAGSYNAAKAAMVTLTQQLALEWGPEGIRVNAIAPGLFPHEDMPEAIRAVRDEAVDNSRQPAGRAGQPHELGWAATYLCSPYASFITGHVLVVDGGNWLRRDFAMPPFRSIKEQLNR
jgi:NAD(P)-dependent dehydrogenase (short-subunit alcohol dehydrogenase family)